MWNITPQKYQTKIQKIPVGTLPLEHLYTPVLGPINKNCCISNQFTNALWTDVSTVDQVEVMSIAIVSLFSYVPKILKECSCLPALELA